MYNIKFIEYIILDIQLLSNNQNSFDIVPEKSKYRSDIETFNNGPAIKRNKSLPIIQ